MVAACYAQLGRRDDVRATSARFEAARPQGFDLGEYAAAQYRLSERQADRDHWRDGYRKAGLPV